MSLKNFKWSGNPTGEWNLVCRATAGTKTVLGIIQLWFNYFVASFFKAFGNVNVNYLKIPKNYRGPHAARAFETLRLRVSEGIVGFWRQQRIFWDVLRAVTLSKCLFCCALSACSCTTMQTLKQWSVPSVKGAMRYGVRSKQTRS